MSTIVMETQITDNSEQIKHLGERKDVVEQWKPHVHEYMNSYSGTSFCINANVGIITMNTIRRPLSCESRYGAESKNA